MPSPTGPSGGAEPSEEMIEAAAREFYRVQHPSDRRWESADPALQDVYRRHARAALTAAFPSLLAALGEAERERDEWKEMFNWAEERGAALARPVRAIFSAAPGVQFETAGCLHDLFTALATYDAATTTSEEPK